MLREKKCFTFIEIMLVVIIIGMLASMVMPRFVGRSKEAKIAIAKADIEVNIATALDLYEMDMGHYPSDIKYLRINPGEENWKGPYLKKDPIDPWKRPYEYTTTDGKSYRLCSKGPDPLNSEDDICSE